MGNPTIAIIGAGNGGQAYAGYLASKGFKVRIFTRSKEKADILSQNKIIELYGKIQTQGEIEFASSVLSDVISGADIILITTTASAHRELAIKMCELLTDNQVVLLSPGRTCGALEFKNIINQNGGKKNLIIGETQTLVFACRLIDIGKVNIIGVKEKVFISAIPSSDTNYLLKKTKPLFSCFYPAKNILHTGLENIGAIFHPCVILFNAASIERGTDFFFYRDMTPRVAAFIEKFDGERKQVGKAYGVDLLGVSDWISTAYPFTVGDNLCEKMKNNPAYYDIKSPSSIYTRQLTEDIPTGIVPIYELGIIADLEMPLFNSMIEISSNILDINFRETGRSLANLGLTGLSKDEIINKLK